MDALYYIYCVVLGQPEVSFYKGSLKKVIYMIDRHAERLGYNPQGYYPDGERIIDVNSMRDIDAHIRG